MTDPRLTGFSHCAVKEKGESKPRQHTIDLSQMAVPIQLAQEKKPSPESPKPSTSSEAEPSSEYNTAGASVAGLPVSELNLIHSNSSVSLLFHLGLIIMSCSHLNES